MQTIFWHKLCHSFPSKATCTFGGLYFRYPSVRNLIHSLKLCYIFIHYGIGYIVITVILVFFLIKFATMVIMENFQSCIIQSLCLCGEIKLRHKLPEIERLLFLLCKEIGITAWKQYVQVISSTTKFVGCEWHYIVLLALVGENCLRQCLTMVINGGNTILELYIQKRFSTFALKQNVNTVQYFLILIVLAEILITIFLLIAFLFTVHT